jgi:predicted CopG family antitoxin
VTKTISLADEAYEKLFAAKRAGESFSDVTRRLAAQDAKSVLFDRTIRVDISDKEAEEWIRTIRRHRDESLRPRVGL